MVTKTSPERAQLSPDNDHSDLASLAIKADHSPRIALAERARPVDEPRLWSDVLIALRLPHMVSWGGSVVRLADGVGRDHRRGAC